MSPTRSAMARAKVPLPPSWAMPSWVRWTGLPMWWATSSRSFAWNAGYVPNPSRATSRSTVGVLVPAERARLAALSSPALGHAASRVRATFFSAGLSSSIRAKISSLIGMSLLVCPVPGRRPQVRSTSRSPSWNAANIVGELCATTTRPSASTDTRPPLAWRAVSSSSIVARTASGRLAPP